MTAPRMIDPAAAFRRKREQARRKFRRAQIAALVMFAAFTLACAFGLFYAVRFVLQVAAANEVQGL